MKLSDFSIDRPVFTTVIIIALIVFGYLGYISMGIDLFPQVDVPVVTVKTELKGANPEIIDMDVTDVLEEQIKTIAGIDNISSVSFEGYSQIVVSFVLEKNNDVAAQEVRDKVAVAMKSMPKDIEQPIVTKVDINATPILYLALTGTGISYRDLAYIAKKKIKERIQSINEVGSITLTGYREREIKVILNAYKLQGYNISPSEINQAIALNHIEMPAGYLQMPNIEYTLKINGEFETAEALSNLIVAYRNNAPVYLKDVAEVINGEEDIRSISRFNGAPAIGLLITKQTDANTVKLAKKVLDLSEKIKKDLPKGVKLQVAFDSSKFIKDSINGATEDLVFGIILTAVLMLFFLRNYRATIISIISIPTSLIACFAVMNSLGFTINAITMLGLSLAVGLVIDDAIVVIENIFRNVEAGRPPLEAAYKGSSEVGFAVIAATLSVAAVFIPVALMKGMIGRFFFQFGLTVAISILFSLWVALTLIPMLCSRWLVHTPSHNKVYMAIEHFLNYIENLYKNILGWALSHKKIILSIGIIALLIGFGLIPFIGKEFITKADESRFIIRYEAPTGSSIDYTDKKSREIENIIISHKEVYTLFQRIGGNVAEEVNKGTFMINLVPKNERDISQADLMNIMRKECKKIAGVDIYVENVSTMGGSGGSRSADIQYVLMGPEITQIANFVDKINFKLKETPGFVDVSSDFQFTKPEMKIFIDRERANNLGLNITNISQNISTMIGGTTVAKFKDKDERFDIRTRARLEDRQTPENIGRIVVTSYDGKNVQLNNVLTMKETVGPNTINRYNRQRSATFFANLHGKVFGDAVKDMERIISEEIKDHQGYEFMPAGLTKTMGESFQYLSQALILAVIIIYLVMAAQFESFIHPFTIMMTLPFTTIGVFGSLLIFGKTLNIFSFIGIIMLMGIVTKNAILLIDFTNRLRKEGADRREALLTAGQIRLRPILMTALAVVCGILPCALALTEGSETRSSMGVAIVGGTITSTLLTLIIIPVLYVILDDFQNKLFGGKKEKKITNSEK